MTNTVREKIFVLASLLVIALFNWSIVQKEHILQTGETVLLELAPVDPRSLLQGDYMRLNYRIDDTAHMGPNPPAHGHIVVAAGPDHVATFVRVDDGSPLHPGEKRLRYHHNASTNVVPNSFLFQEGQAQYFRRAKYGIFKFDGPDNYVLTGLADQERKPIVAPIMPLSFGSAPRR
jgi:uncharacterized membrane-anchored protein